MQRGTFLGDSQSGMPISRILLAISCAASGYCLMISLTEAQRHGGNRKAVSSAAESRDVFKLCGSVAL